MLMYTRPAQPEDFPAIWAAFQDGVAYLGEQGASQWQGEGAPDRALFEKDIANGWGIVLIYDGQVAGYGSLVPGPEEEYEILQGEWVGEEPEYVAIHRVTINSHIRGKGVGKTLTRDLVNLASARGYRDIRIDTFPENIIMQNVITKTDFTYRGMVPFEFGDRLGYQLLVD